MRPQVALSRSNWFRVGGNAEWLFRPDTAAELADFLREKPSSLAVTVLGVGSNVIIRDGGIEGVVIKLGRGFTRMIHENHTIQFGTACLDVNAALFAQNEGIQGLEFLSGIPGTLGGAVMMNAGAYGSELSHRLIQAEIVTQEGEIKTLSHAELGFTYRHSQLPAGAIVTSAKLKAEPGDAQQIAVRMQEIQQSRESTQPVRTQTGGSTFQNPPGYKAWELIDAAGCRGLTQGGAMVSEKHCNFLLNTGSATAADLEALGEEVRERVLAQSGVTLEWEIRRIGIA